MARVIIERREGLATDEAEAASLSRMGPRTRPVGHAAPAGLDQAAARRESAGKPVSQSYNEGRFGEQVSAYTDRKSRGEGEFDCFGGVAQSVEQRTFNAAWTLKTP